MVNGLILIHYYYLFIPVQLCVFDESVPIGEPGAALGTTVRLLALEKKTGLNNFFDLL